MSRTPRTRTPARMAALAAAALLAVTAASGTAAAADHQLRFAADSGDRCLMGSTEGVLAWPEFQGPVRPGVEVTGTVTDGSPICAILIDDGMYTVAAFSAYDDRTVVDQELVKADSGTERFAFVLTPELGPSALVDRVVVQVCRLPLYGTDASGYCGKPQEYSPFAITNG